MNHAAHAELLTFAHRLADASGAMLRTAAMLPPEVDLKSDASFVTNTDKAIELRLRAMIQDTYPGHGIFGEEFENVNMGSEYVWVLDPIDGTAAFVAGIPVYGTLIGLAHEGRPYVGIIDHPITNDRWAGIAGVMAERNGSPIRTRPCNNLKNALGTCSNPDFMNEGELARFTRLRRQLQYVQYGGSCYAYGVLASGRTDLAIDSGLDAFDVIASIAIIEGAGGSASDWQGNGIALGWSGQIIAAGDDQCRKMALEILAAQ
jgi:inositol-phosphate phosphatase/L-galactose 1-phosphate phosphatase/histidinol-phosphatase